MRSIRLIMFDVLTIGRSPAEEMAFPNPASFSRVSTPLVLIFSAVSRIMLPKPSGVIVSPEASRCSSF